MIGFLLKKFVPSFKENPLDEESRKKSSVLCGILGIVCNLILFAVKFIIGSLLNSIAITSDAFNNLSDTGSSVVSIFGTVLSSKKPDKDHPYGHGRLEYLCSLIVAGFIFIVGFDLFKSSAVKIFTAEKATFDIVPVLILTLSLIVKFWMYLYNRYVGKKINSSILIATAKDSINDAFSTLIIIISIIVGSFVNLSFSLDGIMGALVSILIIKSGVDIVREVVDLLLGTPPDPELVNAIDNIICSNEIVIGIHDLVVHDYGPGRVFASVHAEVPDDSNMVYVHEVIDQIEIDIYEKLGVSTTIHMDPICVNSETVNKLRDQISEIAASYDQRISIHDFRITDGQNLVNLIFDIVIPIEIDEKNREEIKNQIIKQIENIDSKYRCVVKIDLGF